jgi:GTPase SAR1 family protein
VIKAFDKPDLPRSEGTSSFLIHSPDTLTEGPRLTTLPGEIRHLARLEEFYLDDNDISALPPEIGDLRALRNLDLEGNCLTSLPREIGQLRNLEQLDLRNNSLKSLPKEIANLANLRRLYLRGNQLKELPPELGRLTSLQKLELDDNQISNLPRELVPLLGGRTAITLAGNPLVDPLPELLARGAPALAAFLMSLEDAVPQYEAKVLVVGEGNVGKTSLVAAVKHEPFIENRETTHGLEVHVIELSHPHLDVPMSVRSWDFGGQEVYRITHQFFFSRRALYVLVWNPRDGQEQDEVGGWLRRIRLRVGTKARALLVATHGNERQPELDYESLVEQFPGMLAGAYRIDSKTGSGIKELREAVAREASALPQMGTMLSSRWIAARDEILGRYREEPQISRTEFEEHCERNGLQRDETTTLLELLHDLGYVIHYGDDDGLRDIVVLNAEWLTKAIGHVLEDKPTRDALGVLDHQRLLEIWGRDGAVGYSPEHYPYFLRLMEKFDVCYRLDDLPHHSLVAQLVPRSRPALPWSFIHPIRADLRAATLAVTLGESAPGLISWLTVRHHNASTKMHWRTGVFLRHPTAAYRSEALIELVNEKRLIVQVRGPSPDLYINVLRDSIEHLLHSRWPGLSYSFAVPCPTVGCGADFPLSGLTNIREKGRREYDCLYCNSTFDVSELLTGFSGAHSDFAKELGQLLAKTELAEIRTREIEAVVRRTDMTVSHTNAELNAIAASIDEMQSVVTESVDSHRRLMKVISVDVSDCPRLFSLAPTEDSIIQRFRFDLKSIQLTLWCEHVGEWHPWRGATYRIERPREWLVRIAPFARLVLGGLSLVAPIASTVAGTLLPKPDTEDLEHAVELMRRVLERVAAAPGDESKGGEALTGALTHAQGRALREFRALLFAHDRSHGFGDLRKVVSPAGDILWVCPSHHTEYDPGLPTIPGPRRSAEVANVEVI